MEIEAFHPIHSSSSNFLKNISFFDKQKKKSENTKIHAQKKAHRNKTRKRVGKNLHFLFICMCVNVCVCVLVTNILNLEGNRNRMQKQIVSYSTERITVLFPVNSSKYPYHFCEYQCLLSYICCVF